METSETKVSVIIPTYNEASNLPKLIKRLRENASPEILVVDGHSIDRTTTTAEGLGVKVISNPSPHRAQQLNLGVRHAAHELLYFVHADTLPPVEYYEDILWSVAAGYDLGCYRFRFASENPMLKINSYFTRFDRLWCRGGDQSLFVKRIVYDQMKGFDEHYSIMEEYDFIKRARVEYKFKIMPRDILVSPRKYKDNSYLRVQWANFVAFRMYRKRKHPDRIKAKYAQLINHRG